MSSVNRPSRCSITLAASAKEFAIASSMPLINHNFPHCSTSAKSPLSKSFPSLRARPLQPLSGKGIPLAQFVSAVYTAALYNFERTTYPQVHPNRALHKKSAQPPLVLEN